MLGIQMALQHAEALATDETHDAARKDRLLHLHCGLQLGRRRSGRGLNRRKRLIDCLDQLWQLLACHPIAA
jgi:hypothetical protein